MELRRTWGGILLLSSNSFTEWLSGAASIGHSFLLLSSHFLSVLFLSSFLEGGNKYVLSCVIQHEAGGLSKTLANLAEVQLQELGENTASNKVTKQIKDGPFFHGAKAEFLKFKRDLISLAKQHGLFRVFTEDVERPVADENKSAEEIQTMGFAEDGIRKHFLAWNILSRAIKCKTDNDILRQVTSPIAAWRILVGSYSAATRGAKLQRMKALTNRRVKPGSNPIHTLSEMADNARDLRANRTDISDEIVCLLFLQVLPEEYDVFRQIIEREKEPLTIDGPMGELRARFDLSRKAKSRSSDTALVAAGSRREKSEGVGAKCTN